MQVIGKSTAYLLAHNTKHARKFVRELPPRGGWAKVWLEYMGHGDQKRDNERYNLFTLRDAMQPWSPGTWKQIDWSCPDFCLSFAFLFWFVSFFPMCLLSTWSLLSETQLIPLCLMWGRVRSRCTPLPVGVSHYLVHQALHCMVVGYMEGYEGNTLQKKQCVAWNLLATFGCRVFMKFDIDRQVLTVVLNGTRLLFTAHQARMDDDDTWSFTIGFCFCFHQFGSK